MGAVDVLRRLRWGDQPHGVALAQDRAAMARSFAYLFGFGATLVFVTLPFGHAHDRFLPGVIVPPIAAYAVVAMLLWGFEQLPEWLFKALPAAGTLLASVVVFSSGAAALGAYAMFYFWVVLASFYFFERRVAALHLLLVATCLTAVLIATPKAHERALLWLMAMGTLTVAGTLVRLLSERMQRLVAQLADAARTDPLTGLLNRRGLTERADVEFSRALRTSQPLAIVVCDVDHFKSVNDHSGHEAGDRALIRVADLLRMSKRGLDAAARIGGEEFALLLPDTDATQALVVAERTRRAFRQTFADDPVELTLSLGIASYPTHGQTAQEVMRAADAALYAAKVGGRNRSKLAESVLDDSAPAQDEGSANDVASSA